MRLSSIIERTESPALRAVTVRLSRQLRASPERIFDAWLAAEEAGAILSAGSVTQVISSEIDARVGGGFRIVCRRGAEEIEYWGEYLEIDRPHRLVFSLFVEKYAQRDDRVTVELAPLEEESLLVLTHELSLQSPAERARVQGAWAMAVNGLAALGSASPAPHLRRLRAAPLAPRDADFA